jgi:hypothetical protein
MKLLKIENKSNIEIMNLISNDATNIEYFISYIAYLVIVPVKTIAIVRILLNGAGSSVFSGLFVFLVSMGLLAIISNLLSQ